MESLDGYSGPNEVDIDAESVASPGPWALLRELYEASAKLELGNDNIQGRVAHALNTRALGSPKENDPPRVTIPVTVPPDESRNPA